MVFMFAFSMVGGVGMGFLMRHFQSCIDLQNLRRLQWQIICAGMKEIFIGISHLLELSWIGRWTC